MAESRPFVPVKLICGVMVRDTALFSGALERLSQVFGRMDLTSSAFKFTFSDYYHKQMGGAVERMFLSFSDLISPENLSSIKLQTNELEEIVRREQGSDQRVINLDPGILSASSLVMATTKDFAHRIPLQNGIYAHLELLFGKDMIRTLEWTYPDFKTGDYDEFFLEVRRIYLQQFRFERD
ncbi:MAG: DUF4416 family protein [Candidatus Aminicenantes bacterium]|nr:DUF4416 family protein [Candidatus Aminicenantes bacterium]